MASLKHSKTQASLSEETLRQSYVSRDKNAHLSIDKKIIC